MSSPPDDATPPPHVTQREALRAWVRIAGQSFGGPAGQIAVMHRILVEERRWLTEDEFLHALNFCMLLPGPEAQQLVTYSGWKLHGVRGGLTAGLLFILPGAAALLLLSWLYVAFRDVRWLESLFFGIKAAVLAIVLEAVIRIGKRALKSPLLAMLAVASFLAMFFGQVSFPWIVVSAALCGWVCGRVAPSQFPVVRPAQTATVDEPPPVSRTPAWSVLARRTLGTAALWITIWFAPVGIVSACFGTKSIFVAEGLFFSRTAVVSFGGAYAVLAYLAQEAVETYRWVAPGEMQDGLGLAETTPGPLIMVVQFVAFLAAYRNPGTLDPWLAAVIGSALTTWVTFAPSFLWIFTFAPYLESLRRMAALNRMLAAITSAVVGAILNLSMWFTLHTLFGTVVEWHPLPQTPLRIWSPDWSTLDAQAVVIAALAMLALFRFHLGMVTTLAGAAALGWLFRSVG